VGLALAYLFVPVVNWLEKRLPPRRKVRGRWMGFKRVASVLIVFFLLFGLLGFFVYMVASAVIEASMTLVESAPSLISKGLYQIQMWFEGLREYLPAGVRNQLDQVLIDAGVAVGRAIQGALLGGVVSIPKNFGAILGFAALPFFLFYIMKDSRELSRGFHSVFPKSIAGHVRNITLIVERVTGRYLRAQLLLGLIVGYLSFIGLLLLKVPFAPVLAILAGITELIPTLGPWIGGGVAAIVVLAVDPQKLLWVIVLFLAVQMVENYFLVPRVQSAYLRIHPAVMIFLLVLGAYIAGIWGLLFIGPLTATAVEIYRYMHREFAEGEPQDPTNIKEE
jgi:predicted PurR-regulated permease PerM